jgi:hypothetical protein
MLGDTNKSLSLKLGLKPGFVLSLLNAPEDYGHLLFPIPEGGSIYDELKEPADCIQYFTKSKTELKDIFPKLKTNLKKDGSLWISWPKKASKIPTDLDENIIREIGLDNGLVDIKVIAIDEVWSGLKFVYKVKDR